MFFFVDGKGLAFVGVLQVNAERRNARNGIRQLHELVFNFIVAAILSHHDLARNAQIAIKPRVPQTAAVAFHTQLDAVVLDIFFAARFDAQIGRIGVTANNVKACWNGLVVHLAAHGKGHER